MSGHADPVFHERYDFCRVTCPECQRLDAADTRPQSERMGDGIARAINAARDPEAFAIPMPEEL